MQKAVGQPVADCVYGSNARLHAKLQADQYRYVLAVRCTEAIEIQTPTGRVRMTVAEADARFIQAQDWQRLLMGEGTKGPRWFDWVCLPMLHQCEDDGHHWLLIRRLPTDSSKKTYYFVFAPVGTTLSEMVQAISARLSTAAESWLFLVFGEPLAKCIDSIPSGRRPSGDYASCKSLCRKRGKPARPYMTLLSVFNLLTFPSVVP